MTPPLLLDGEPPERILVQPTPYKSDRWTVVAEYHGADRFLFTDAEEEIAWAVAEIVASHFGLFVDAGPGAEITITQRAPSPTIPPPQAGDLIIAPRQNPVPQGWTAEGEAMWKRVDAGEVCNTGSGKRVICSRGGIGCDVDHGKPARPPVNPSNRST